MSTPSKVWLITGCATGLGRALARHALAQGHRVVATARQPSTLQPLLDQHPDTARIFPLDVTNAAQVKATVRAGLDAFGRIDVVVNNAGYGLVGALEECSEEQIWRNFNTNFFGALRVLRATLPLLRTQRSGHLINISAAAAIANYAGFSVYGAAKCALEGVSEALALELRPFGIKVTVVQPGPFRTDFIRRSLDRSVHPIADYAATSGKFAAYLDKIDGTQPGDPARAAESIFNIAGVEKPPLRLTLGSYAQGKVLRKADTLKNEAETWKEFSLPTDFVA